jgi:Lrp/AsnC family leucine-responsive transcriptional regulator
MDFARIIPSPRDTGFVTRYVAVLNAEAVGLRHSAILNFKIQSHGQACREGFESAISKIEEVVECFAVTGESDYIARVLTRDLSAFSTLMLQSILPLPGLATVRTSLVIDEVKAFGVVPLAHLGQEGD